MTDPTERTTRNDPVGDRNTAAERQAAEVLREAGGGERMVHGRDGRIRSKDTISPRGGETSPPPRSSSSPRPKDVKVGQDLTEERIAALVAEAEAGYDLDTLRERRPKRGRPTLGSAAASVESVRLDPELRHELAERARHENTTTSEIIREALRRFLHAA
jgi:hypothetical protein